MKASTSRAALAVAEVAELVRRGRAGVDADDEARRAGCSREVEAIVMRQASEPAARVSALNEAGVAEARRRRRRAEQLLRYA